MCLNADVIARHHAKVYGKAKVGAPPMSVPHLDTRSIDGQKGLLFGPYAGLLHEVPETGFVPGLALLRAARQRRAPGHVRHPQCLAGPLPDWRGAAVVHGPPAGPSGVLSGGPPGGLGAADGRTACPNHPQGPKTGTYLQFGTEVVNSAATGRCRPCLARRLEPRHRSRSCWNCSRAASRSGYRATRGRRRCAR